MFLVYWSLNPNFRSSFSYTYQMKKLYTLTVFALFMLLQNIATAQTTSQSELKYVRINIGHGGFHCPFLGPQLERKLTETGQVSNIKVNKQESYATFEIPAASTLSDVDIRQVAIKVGYPEADVSVVISDTAPVTHQ